MKRWGFLACLAILAIGCGGGGGGGGSVGWTYWRKPAVGDVYSRESRDGSANVVVAGVLSGSDFCQMAIHTTLSQQIGEGVYVSNLDPCAEGGGTQVKINGTVYPMATCRANEVAFDGRDDVGIQEDILALRSADGSLAFGDVVSLPSDLFAFFNSQVNLSCAFLEVVGESLLIGGVWEAAESSYYWGEEAYVSLATADSPTPPVLWRDSYRANQSTNAPQGSGTTRFWCEFSCGGGIVVDTGISPLVTALGNEQPSPWVPSGGPSDAIAITGSQGEEVRYVSPATGPLVALRIVDPN
ncbi:hypothetical protein H8D30_04290 [bacterium]|nr:hypothetical protein [bacterium]